MIVSFFSEHGAMQWALLGFLLLIVEMIMPATFFMWFGLAALALAAINLAVDLPFLADVILFAILALALVAIYRRGKQQRHVEDSDRPLLNRRTEQLIGEVHALLEPIENGRGRLQIGDAYWRVTGPDLPAGQRVKIIGVRDLVLEVREA
ncbi:MAG: NfeD family protein [Xanthomonadales bacterium]|nr:NfeD family protein [Xanthomonadales bacterium]